MNRWTRVLLSVALVLPILRAGAVTSPQTPAAELRSFEFADKALTAELVAAEPDVVSPVSICWDAAGRLFVAEMRDYPNATNGGTIRLLQDRNRDGRYETTSVFADNLHFPNSVLPWNGGVLVTAAPDLIFLKDTDGDGRADERRVLFTGFGTGNQQLRANGLTWGVDGWVYGANGRSDGNVHRPGDIHTNSLRGRDFRFRPGTGEFETLAGRSQFGLAMDEWGRRFLSWNTIPIRQEVFPDRYLSRNPDLPAADVLCDLLPTGDAGQVFPLTPPPQVFNNESGSHFNALAGLTIYHGHALGRHYRGNVFVGETLRNLVHRRVLVPDGVTFIARRGEQQTEFFRSVDPWFHPVNFATGPDEALYVVDFYRQFVEHPDFVPKEMRTAIPWSAGSERGRIWRVIRKPARGKSIPSPVQFPDSPRPLVRQLQSPNSWHRTTAHRLIVEKQHPDTIEPLRRLVRQSRQPESRFLALTALDAMGKLDDASLVRGLHDIKPRIREASLILAEPVLGRTGIHHDLVSSVYTLSNDPDPRVVLQAALALGSLASETTRESGLAELLDTNVDPWVRLAALSSSRSTPKSRIIALLPQSNVPLRPPPAPIAPDPNRQQIVERYSAALKLTGNRAPGAATFGQLCLPCHYFQGQGQRVGPDLSGIASRPVDMLLSDLLDPKRQIAPDYTAYEVTLMDGETLIGLIASETSTRVTIRRPGSPDENIPRSKIQSLKPATQSLMPDGLEAGLSVEDFANLLAFLRNPDAALLPK